MKARQLFLIWMVCILLGGCAETPEESAVVSKAGGILSNRQEEALEEGTFRQMDVPKQWTGEITRGDKQIVLQADLDIAVPKIGNIPVVELEEQTLSDEMLKKFCNYFSKGQALYHPPAMTKAQLMEIHEKASNKEGNYGNPYQLGTLGGFLVELEQLIERAPEQEGDKQEVLPAFGKAWYWEKELVSGKVPGENDDWQKNVFTAWVDSGKGMKNAPIIMAQKDGSIRKRGSAVQIETGGFSYYAADVIDEELRWGSDLRRMKEIADSKSSGASEKYRSYVKALEEALTEPIVSFEDAKEKADSVITELGLEGLVFSKGSRALIVPRDGSWNGPGEDLSEIHMGYSFLYHRSSVEELPGASTMNVTLYENLPETNYAPPFMQEYLIITVGEEGICRFEWGNPAKQVDIVAENVILLDFEEIKERLADHLLYAKAYVDEVNGFDSSQMWERYEVENVALCMVYTNAYEHPERAWLVPAWVFELQWYSNIQGREELKREKIQCIIGAIDGGYISPY